MVFASAYGNLHLEIFAIKGYSSCSACSSQADPTSPYQNKIQNFLHTTQLFTTFCYSQNFRSFASCYFGVSLRFSLRKFCFLKFAFSLILHFTFNLLRKFAFRRIYASSGSFALLNYALHKFRKKKALFQER